MKYRQLRKRDTGQWLNVLFTVDGPEFSVKPESHEADIARAMSLLPAELRVVDSDTDLRTGPLLSLPVVAPPPPTPEQQAWANATAVQKIDLLARKLGFLP